MGDTDGERRGGDAGKAGGVGVQELLAILPHRYPMLMIDRVVRVEPGREVVCLKNVSFNEPFFNGHFPGDPVMPGVLLLEAIAQAAGVLAGLSGFPAAGVYFARADEVRFRKPVRPGDQLVIHVTREREKPPVYWARGVIEADGVAMCSARVTLCGTTKEETEEEGRARRLTPGG